MVSIFSADGFDAQLDRGAEVLREGRLVLLPTETVYGAAGLLSHPQARQRLHALRGQPDSQPFTIHLDTGDRAKQYLGPVSELGNRLMRKLWPGPVGLVFDVPADRRREVAAEWGLGEQELYDKSGAITLRCPDHAVTQEIIAQVAGPVVLTVADVRASLPGAAMADELDGKVDLILDAGPTRYNQPSTILKVEEDHYRVVREGIFDRRIIERLLRTTILYVCSGNTCRSAMAEALTRQMLAQKAGVSEEELEQKGINVISAGAFAMPGSRATPQAVDAVRELGGDLSSHRSRPLSVELIHQADLIFAMSRAHAAAVTALVPSAVHKVDTLDPQGDIEDPMGSDLQRYQSLARQMRILIEQRLKEKEKQLLGAQ